MKIVGGSVDTASDDYQQNLEQMLAVNQELEDIIAQTMDVGQRQRSIAEERDKLLPRERINAIIDKGSPFLEIG